MVMMMMVMIRMVKLVTEISQTRTAAGRVLALLIVEEKLSVSHDASRFCQMAIEFLKKSPKKPAIVAMSSMMSVSTVTMIEQIGQLLVHSGHFLLRAHAR